MKLPSINNRSLFLACLVVSCIVWLLNALAEEHTTLIEVPLQYNNLPKDKINTAPLTQQLNLMVKGTGFNLLKQLLSANQHPLSLNYERYAPISLLPTVQLTNSLNQQLKNVQIQNIRPDILSFQFEEKVTKHVPVQLNSSLNFTNAYFLKDSIGLFPQKVQLIGPISVLQDIEYWETDSLVLQDIKAHQNGKINLKTPKIYNLTIQPKVCNYNFKVDSWTEKELELPIKVVNLPDSLNVYLYPKTVQLHFQLPLSAYETYVADLFEVVADYERLDSTGSRLIPLELETDVLDIQRVYLRPEEVEVVVYGY